MYSHWQFGTMIPLRVSCPYKGIAIYSRQNYILRRHISIRRRWREHPVSCVIHVDVVTHMTIVKDECTLRKSRALMPEYIDVTNSVFRPYIELGTVSRRGLQRSPLIHCGIPKGTEIQLFETPYDNLTMSRSDSCHSERRDRNDLSLVESRPR
jgi:hypothetical protein